MPQMSLPKLPSFPWMHPYPSEDMEKVDEDAIVSLMDKYLQDTYPDFEPEIVYGLEKEYFLPALKVLKWVDGEFFSPGYESLWQDGELKAECKGGYGYIGHLSDASQDDYIHSAPYERCECGIYGSVNLEEVLDYTHLEHKANIYIQYPPKLPMGDGYNLYSDYPGRLQRREPEIKNVICIIEPSPDAKVIVCRKGWKASHAFISEIVGDTISINDTSRLLSIAWKRNIDVRRIYENR